MKTVCEFAIRGLLLVILRNTHWRKQ